MNRSMCKRLVHDGHRRDSNGAWNCSSFSVTFGADSFSCFNFGISSLTPLPFYAVTGSPASILLIPGLLFARHLIHLGTLLSFSVRDSRAQFFINCFRKGFGKIHILPMRITLLCCRDYCIRPGGVLVFFFQFRAYSLRYYGVLCSHKK